MALSAFGVEDGRIRKDNNGHGGLGLTAGLAAGGTAGYLARPKLQPRLQPLAQKVAGSPVGQKVGQAAGAVGGKLKGLLGFAKADQSGNHPVLSYGAGGLVSYGAGSAIGRNIGAKKAGTTLKDINAGIHSRVSSKVNAGEGDFRRLYSAAKKTHGFREANRGGLIGGAAGLAAGTAGIAAYRHNRRK
jgi:hypothetical protein